MFILGRPMVFLAAVATAVAATLCLTAAPIAKASTGPLTRQERMREQETRNRNRYENDAQRVNSWDYVMRRGGFNQVPRNFACDQSKCTALNCRSDGSKSQAEQFACFMMVNTEIQFKRLTGHAGDGLTKSPDSVAVLPAEPLRAPSEPPGHSQPSSDGSRPGLTAPPPRRPPMPDLGAFRDRMAAIDRFERRQHARNTRSTPRVSQEYSAADQYMYYYFR